MKRAFDVLASGTGLLLLSPLLALVALSVWLEDRHSPFYVAPRVGRDGKTFRMVKFRTMVVDADRTGVDSTAGDDPRITRVGSALRSLKLDELPQLLNVLRGDMSLVGPRPQVARDVALYTDEERRLLSVRPGITDFASIVFADESDILEGSNDPDLRYNQIIRPWKSRMGLVYVERSSPGLDLRLLAATLLGAVDRRRALAWVSRLLERAGAEPKLVRIAARTEELEEGPPPGAREVVRSRETTKVEAR